MYYCTRIYREKTRNYIAYTKVNNNYDPNQYLAVTEICQAMGKQWIGHFVTLSKWDEKWFYDGLHTYLQKYCVLEVSLVSVFSIFPNKREMVEN